MFFGALFAGMLAVVIIIIFVIHGIVDQFRSCLGNMAFIFICMGFKKVKRSTIKLRIQVRKKIPALCDPKTVWVTFGQS